MRILKIDGQKFEVRNNICGTLILSKVGKSVELFRYSNKELTRI